MRVTQFEGLPELWHLWGQRVSEGDVPPQKWRKNVIGSQLARFGAFFLPEMPTQTQMPNLYKNGGRGAPNTWIAPLSSCWFTYLFSFLSSPFSWSLYFFCFLSLPVCCFFSPPLVTLGAGATMPSPGYTPAWHIYSWAKTAPVVPLSLIVIRPHYIPLVITDQHSRDYVTCAGRALSRCCSDSDGLKF